MQRVKIMILRVFVNVVKKSASIDANTACAFLNFQPEVPQAVKKLRKF